MTQNTFWGEASLVASRKLNLISDETINKVLLAVADEAIAKTDIILAENQKDLTAMDKANPMYDRLLLSAERIKGIATDIKRLLHCPRL